MRRRKHRSTSGRIAGHVPRCRGSPALGKHAGNHDLQDDALRRGSDVTPSSGPAPQVLGFHPKKVTRERRRSENSTTAPRRRATSTDTAPSAFARSIPTSAPSCCRTRMGEPQRRQHANPLAQAPLARRRRHHHARPPTSPPAEANGPDRPSPPRPDLKPRDAVASRQPRAAGSPSPARGRDIEEETPTTTGSRRQPRTLSAQRSPPPRSSGAGFTRRTHPTAMGGGTCCRGERRRRT